MNKQNARTRLTLYYLGVIMALTLGFSAVLYVQSINEAKGNLQRQERQLRNYLYFTTPEGVAAIQDHQLNVFRRNLLKRLVILNIGMLAIGGYVSYLLARRSLRPLEETLEAQSRFTSDAAHELRTPLTAMKTEIEVALRARNLKPVDARETLTSVLEEIGKLDTLTSALLRLAKGTSDADKAAWQKYRLQDVLEAAGSRVAGKASARDITMHITPTKLHIRGDDVQLIELFVTLLDNAVKYSPEGTAVSITAALDGNMVRTEVRDQGIGIAEVDLPHIFERFYRADPSRNKTKADGYGLGLSLADSIVRAHGGKITAESAHGKGSVFTVLLPHSD